MRKIYVFEGFRTEWQKWYPMLHIEPVSNEQAAMRKYQMLCKKQTHCSWRVMVYESARVLPGTGNAG